jgi:hypothetical protein
VTSASSSTDVKHPLENADDSFAFINAEGHELEHYKAQMDGTTVLLTALVAWPALLAFLYFRGRGSSLSHLRGPEPASFWLGTFLYPQIL